MYTHLEGSLVKFLVYILHIVHAFGGVDVVVLPNEMD